jgi:50S ribosomal protein L16 3-hydroxylase
MADRNQRSRSHRAERDQFDPQRLLGSMSLRQFRGKYWPDHAWIGRRASHRLDLLEHVPQLRGLSALLDTRGIYLSAVSPQYRSDQLQDRGLTAAKAKRLYASGWTLTIGGLHEVVPELGRLLSELATTLGLPVAGSLARHRCIAYASPVGEALACHFDPSANFVLQLSGRKRWRIAANRSVENPVDVYSTRVSAERAGRLATYADPERLPKMMPGPSRSVDVTPGTLMFLPRGYWHETEALEDSLSIHFVLHQPSWADVWATAIQDRLIRHSRWRSLADGLWSAEPAVRRRAARRLTAVAKTWTKDVGPLSVESMLAAMFSSPHGG